MFARSEVKGRAGLLARIIVSAASVLTLSLGSAGLLLAQDDHGAGGGGGGLFDINWPGLMFWTWLIFIILLLILRKWAWGPILGALDAREKRIQDALDGAAAERDEAQKLLDQQRQALAETRDEAQSILADSRKAAERLRAEMVDEARGEKDRIVAGARDEIRHERDQALDALRREAVDLSIQAAGRVLDKNLDSDENRRLVDEYIDSLVKSEGDGAD
jgi:F-type H+-transporting ATPase subunit b